MRHRCRRTARSSSTTATNSSRFRTVASSRTSAGRLERLFLLLAVAAAAITARPAAQTAAPSSAAGWRRFRGNPRLTGIAAGTAPATLQPRWTYDAGDAIESSAAIHDGAVYVGSAAGDLLSLEL